MSSGIALADSAMHGNAQRARVLAQLGHHFQPVQIGQLHVQQDQRRRDLGRLAQAAAAVGRAVEDQAGPALGQLLHDHHVDGVVLDVEQYRLVAGGHGSGGCSGG
jgi:hypothetical protein